MNLSLNQVGTVTVILMFLLPIVLPAIVLGLLYFVNRARISRLDSSYHFSIVAFAVVLFGILAFLTFITFYAVGINVRYALVSPSLQNALDEQCGIGIVRVDQTGFNDDPSMSWNSAEQSVFCHVRDNSWMCSC
jgi:hypothetical protein